MTAGGSRRPYSGMREIAPFCLPFAYPHRLCAHTGRFVGQRGLPIADVGEGEELGEVSPEPDSAIEDGVSVAETLVERRSGHFDPGHFVDRYEAGLRQIIEAKRRGMTPQVVEEHESTTVVDLMEALKRSLAEEGEAGRRTG